LFGSPPGHVEILFALPWGSRSDWGLYLRNNVAVSESESSVSDMESTRACCRQRGEVGIPHPALFKLAETINLSL